MKNFKKKLASLLALVSIVSCMSAIPTYAAASVPENTTRVEITKDEFNTMINHPIEVYKEYLNVEYDVENNKTTIIFHKSTNDATGVKMYTTAYDTENLGTFTINALADELIYKFIDDNTCYIVGYAVDLCGGDINNLLTSYFTGIDNTDVNARRKIVDKLLANKKYKSIITLPDGNILTNPLNHIQALYDLDGNYIGYSENMQSNDTFPPSMYKLVSNTTIGDSSTTSNKKLYNLVNSPTIGDSSTIGDSDVLPSEPTGIRGDVNYDGKVNVADIITLRRYLLHIIEW